MKQNLQPDSNRYFFIRVGAIFFVIAIAALIVHIVSLRGFNQKEHILPAGESEDGSSFVLAPRAGDTSSWLKRDFELDGQTVDLTGITIDGDLNNDSFDMISDWTLRIRIVGDCFINQAWNGEVEIHQFAGTDQEAVQQLNLQQVSEEDVALQYRYDGDLLIPLKEGDEVIYHPSENALEQPVVSGNSITIGMIFYYLDELDLSDYDLIFHYHRSFAQGMTFYVFVASFLLALILTMISVIANIMFRKAQMEVELRKSGIVSMSEIYNLIYFINLTTDEMTPVSVPEEIETNRPKDIGAKEWIRRIIESDVEEDYRETMLEFGDISTLPRRLENRSSVAREFRSKQFGWRSIRFFALDRIPGHPLEKVIFTTQDINAEKEEITSISRRISKAEANSADLEALFLSAAKELSDSLHVLLDEEGQLSLSDQGDKENQEKLLTIQRECRRMLLKADTSLELVEGTLEKKMSSEVYSLKQLITETAEAVRPLLREKDLNVDLAPSLPDRLIGDASNLQKCMIHMLLYESEHLVSGSLTLAAYAKEKDQKTHVVVSVQANGERTCQMQEETTYKSVSLRLASGLADILGTSIEETEGDEGWDEIYFEIDQPTADQTIMTEQS